MSFLDKIKKNLGVEIGKDGKPTGFSKITSLEQAANYIADLKQKMHDGTIKPEMQVTTATSMERREFLNYAISLVPDKYMKHKILLFLRVNPYWEDPATGREAYLSKREIARCLSDRVGYRVLEVEVEGIERDAINIIKETLEKKKVSAIPLVGGRF